MISAHMHLLIETLVDHEAAMSRLEALMILDPPEESDEAKELVALGIAIDAFEKRVFVI